MSQAAPAKVNAAGRLKDCDAQNPNGERTQLIAHPRLAQEGTQTPRSVDVTDHTDESHRAAARGETPAQPLRHTALPGSERCDQVRVRGRQGQQRDSAVMRRSDHGIGAALESLKCVAQNGHRRRNVAPDNDEATRELGRAAKHSLEALPE
jgi:hypothetical protein